MSVGIVYNYISKQWNWDFVFFIIIIIISKRGYGKYSRENRRQVLKLFSSHARHTARSACLPFAWTVMIIIIIIYYNIYHYCGYYILSSLCCLCVWLSYNSGRHYLVCERVYNVHLWTLILMMSVTKWFFIFMIIIIVYTKPWQNIIYNIMLVWSISTIYIMPTRTA